MSKRSGDMLDPQEVADCMRLYSELGTVEAVAERMGMTRESVSRRLATRGGAMGMGKRKPKVVTPEERAEIVRVFRECGSKGGTARRLKMALNRVEDVLSEELGVL